MINPDLTKKAILKKKIDGLVYTLQILQTSDTVLMDDIPMTEIIKGIQKDIIELETGDPVSLEVIEDKIEMVVNVKLKEILDPTDSASLVSQIVEIKSIIKDIIDDEDIIIDQSKEYTDEKFSEMKEYVDDSIEDAKDKTAFHFEGRVDYYDDLPTDVNEGAVYIVKYAGNKSTGSLHIVNSTYWFNGVEWVPPSTDIDLSEYLTNDDFNKYQVLMSDRIMARARVILSKDPPANLRPNDIWLEDIE